MVKYEENEKNKLIAGGIMSISKEKWVKMYQDKGYWEKIIYEVFSKIGVKISVIENTYPGTHAVFRINKKYIIKIYWDKFRSDYDIENEMIEYQEKVKKYFSGEIKGFKILVIDYLDGNPVREYYEKKEKINETIIIDLANTVKRYHNTDLKKIKSLNSKNWEIYFYNKKRYLVENGFNYPGFSERLRKELLQKFIDLDIKKYNNLKLIHADLTEDHILIKDGKFAGIIDFADSRIAPVEYEWVALFLSGLNKNIEYFKYFLEVYGIEYSEKILDDIVIFIFLHQFSEDIVKEVFKEKDFQSIKDIKDYWI